MGDSPERIGPYPIERELGRGGMGIVYLGRDPDLGRAVAVKVLPDPVAADPERMARFEREARLLAAVHHPNVASIFAVGADGGRRYLALEYVPGETLADRLARGPLPLAEALEVCRQIAAGVECAHDAGVVHRDLKPANVRLTPEGAVKVLDFGLAKAGQPAGSGSGPEASETLAFTATEEGVVLGTLPYMSPEQARGHAVDRRSDVWALGCILFECLSGRGAFTGDSATDVLAGIVLRDPPWEALPAGTPARVRELLQRCLEKDRNRRLRDIGDARLELETALAERQWSGAAPAAPTPAMASLRRRRRLGAALAGVFLLLAGAAAGVFLARGLESAPTPVRRLSVVFPPDLHVEDGGITADGRSLVVMARPRGGSELERRLYRRPLDSFDLEPIPGTERVVALLSPAAGPADGQLRFIAGRAGGEGGRQLFRVPLDGRAPPTLEGPWEVGWENAALLGDGRLLVTVDRGRSYLLAPPGALPGGTPRTIQAGFTGHLDPLAVRGDEWLFMRSYRYTEQGFREGSAVLDVATGRATPLLEQGVANGLTADGYLLFSRGETLLAAPYDRAARRITGRETGMLSGLRVAEVGLGGAFDLASDGTLAFPAGGRVDDRQLVACEPGGRCTPWAPLRRFFFGLFDVSPRHGAVAVVFPGRGDNYEIWSVDGGGALQQLVARDGRDVMSPVWSPDGASLAFYNDEVGDDNDGTWVTELDGGEPHPLAVGRQRYWPAAWLGDGQRVVLGRGQVGEDANDVLLLDLRRGGPPRTLLGTRFREVPLDVAPDGRHLALLSDQSGVFEAYLTELEPDGGAGPLLPLSRGGATWGQFARDGRAFYFSDDRGGAYRVELSADGRPAEGEPRPLLDLTEERLAPQFSVLPDGRLLFVRREGAIERFEIVLGFADEVRRRMGGQER